MTGRNSTNMSDPYLAWKLRRYDGKIRHLPRPPYVAWVHVPFGASPMWTGGSTDHTRLSNLSPMAAPLLKEENSSSRAATASRSKCEVRSVDS